jgi:alpha-tubulin suppressor-like RCC1 family protein
VYTVADKLVESNSIPVTQPHRKGDGALTPHLVPQLQKKGRRVIKVGCASGFNVALSRSGKVYGWGSSSLFPLRTKDNRTATPGIPHTIRALKVRHTHTHHRTRRAEY